MKSSIWRSWALCMLICKFSCFWLQILFRDRWNVAVNCTIFMTGQVVLDGILSTYLIESWMLVNACWNLRRKQSSPDKYLDMLFIVVLKYLIFPCKKCNCLINQSRLVISKVYWYYDSISIDLWCCKTSVGIVGNARNVKPLPGRSGVQISDSYLPS